MKQRTLAIGLRIPVPTVGLQFDFAAHKNNYIFLFGQSQSSQTGDQELILPTNKFSDHIYSTYIFESSDWL